MDERATYRVGMPEFLAKQEHGFPSHHIVWRSDRYLRDYVHEAMTELSDDLITLLLTLNEPRWRFESSAASDDGAGHLWGGQDWFVTLAT